jgi:hypothetical protein
MNTYAPVVVFSYRRPDHLRNTLESLMKCHGFDESRIIVYGDGPKGASETEAVLATREVARTILGERAEYHFSDVHLGLSCSVIAGVSDAVARFGRVIVVEDDLLLNPFFLTFINQGLDRYENDAKVFQVSGYMVGVSELKNCSSALFLPFTVSWGWGTWRQAWERFDPLAEGWERLRIDRNSRRRFNLDGTYDYTTMLERQMQGLRDSWAIRWYWSVFRNEGVVLFPPRSLVDNTGFDGSGSHGRGLLRRFSTPSDITISEEFDLPEAVLVDENVFAFAKKAIWQQNGGWLAYFMDRVRRLFRN